MCVGKCLQYLTKSSPLLQLSPMWWEPEWFRQKWNREKRTRGYLSVARLVWPLSMLLSVRRRAEKMKRAGGL